MDNVHHNGGRFLLPRKARYDCTNLRIGVGCGESCPIFPGTHYEDWEVADPSGKPVEVVREIRDEITKRVKELLTRIS